MRIKSIIANPYAIVILRNNIPEDNTGINIYSKYLKTISGKDSS